jgi:NAD:arginine ADP-ribosyltransferase
MASNDVGVRVGNQTERILRLSCGIAQEPLQIFLSIQGYETAPLVALDQAVTPLVSLIPDVLQYARAAIRRCPTPTDGCSCDESAAILLYSKEWRPHDCSLYIILNSTLRSRNRQKLKPWYLYMKLLLTALSKVPPVSQVVYRGAIGDLSNIYPTGWRFAWWGFSSCTAKSEVLEQFLDSAGKRTIFNIECDTGKDIRRHSENEKEEEVLLLPGRQFQVVSCVRAGTDFHIIQLKEVSSTASVVPLPPWPEAIRHIKLDIHWPGSRRCYKTNNHYETMC